MYCFYVYLHARLDLLLDQARPQRPQSLVEEVLFRVADGNLECVDLKLTACTGHTELLSRLVLMSWMVACNARRSRR